MGYKEKFDRFAFLISSRKRIEKPSEEFLNTAAASVIMVFLQKSIGSIENIGKYHGNIYNEERYDDIIKLYRNIMMDRFLTVPVFYLKIVVHILALPLNKGHTFRTIILKSLHVKFTIFEVISI